MFLRKSEGGFKEMSKGHFSGINQLVNLPIMIFDKDNKLCGRDPVSWKYAGPLPQQRQINRPRGPLTNLRHSHKLKLATFTDIGLR